MRLAFVSEVTALLALLPLGLIKLGAEEGAAKPPASQPPAAEQQPIVVAAEKIEELLAAIKATKAKVVLVNVWTSG